MIVLNRKIQTFLKLSIRQKKIFFWVIGLSIYRYFLKASGSRKAFAEKLVKFQGDSSNLTKKQSEIALDIAKAIKLGGKYIPWSNECRHQAWQAVFLLNYFQIPYSHYVGVNKTKYGKIEGHSWVFSGNYFISGQCNIEKMVTLNTNLIN